MSDPGMEDALYEIESMRRSAGMKLCEDEIPDETTILKLRRLLVAGKVYDYNHRRLHSVIDYIAPEGKFVGRAPEILVERERLLQSARNVNPFYSFLWNIRTGLPTSDQWRSHYLLSSAGLEKHSWSRKLSVPGIAEGVIHTSSSRPTPREYIIRYQGRCLIETRCMGGSSESLVDIGDIDH